MGQTLKHRGSAASAKFASVTRAASRAAAGEVRHQPPLILASAAILLALALTWIAEILLSFRHGFGITGRERVVTFFGVGSIGWAAAVLLAVLLWVLARRRIVTDSAPTSATSSSAGPAAEGTGGAGGTGGTVPATAAGPVPTPTSPSLGVPPDGETLAGGTPAGAGAVAAGAGAPSATAAAGAPPAAPHERPLGKILPDALLASAILVGGSALIDFLVELTNFGHGIDATFGGLFNYLAVLPVAAAAAWWVLAELSTGPE